MIFSHTEFSKPGAEPRFCERATCWLVTAGYAAKPAEQSCRAGLGCHDVRSLFASATPTRHARLESEFCVKVKPLVGSSRLSTFLCYSMDKSTKETRTQLRGLRLQVQSGSSDFESTGLIGSCKRHECVFTGSP